MPGQFKQNMLMSLRNVDCKDNKRTGVQFLINDDFISYTSRWR
jgi:hypothetical protein